MKKKISLFLVMALTAILSAFSQTRELQIWRDGSLLQSFAVADIDSVTIGYSDDIHEFVDLGLPSGTLWATMNVGASKPEDYGSYYAWGETEGYNNGKSTFNESTYKWCNGSYNTQTKYNTSSSYGTVDYKTELELADDAAYVNWGKQWRIPSKEQFQELINSSYTTTEWTSVNGVNGRLVTSKTNGNFIFLPAAGYRDGTSLDNAGSNGYYWSRTLDTRLTSDAYYLGFGSSNIDTRNFIRGQGRSVRPVRLSE